MPAITPQSASLSGVEGRSDASIMHVLKQKIIIDELMKAAKNGSASTSGEGETGLPPSAAPTAAAGPLLSSLPSLSALQMHGLAGHNNLNALSSLSLGDQATLLQNNALQNELLLGSIGANHRALSGSPLLANDINLAAAAASQNPAALLAAQSRINMLSPLSQLSTAGNPNLLAQQYSNDALLNNMGNVSAMNEARRNLLLSSLLARPPAPQQPSQLRRSPGSPPKTEGGAAAAQPKDHFDHTQIMSGAVSNLLKRQKLLEKLEANLNIGIAGGVPVGVGQYLPNMGGGHGRHASGR